MDGKELEQNVETKENIEVDDRDAKIESLEKAINAIRSENKRLKSIMEKEQEEDEADAKVIEDNIRAKLKSGKSELSDEVIEDLMNTFGKSLAKNEAKSARKEIEKEIMELKRTRMDAEEYGKEIRALMKNNGLTAEQAYWVVAGESKLSEAEKKKTTDDEKQEKQKLNAERAKEGYIDTSVVAKDKDPNYTAKEKAIANFSNMSLEEASARSKAFKLDDILALNSKYKKGGK